jgi:hypothetical protein
MLLLCKSVATLSNDSVHIRLQVNLTLYGSSKLVLKELGLLAPVFMTIVRKV